MKYQKRKTKKNDKGNLLATDTSDFKIISILLLSIVAKDRFIFYFVLHYSGFWLLLKMPFLITRELLASSGIHKPPLLQIEKTIFAPKEVKHSFIKH